MNPVRLDRWFACHPRLTFVLFTLITYGAYKAAILPSSFNRFHLGAEHFDSPSVLFASLRSDFGAAIWIFILAGTLYLARRGPWTRSGLTPKELWFVRIMILLFAWEVVTIDFNLMTGRWNPWDRVCVVGLALAGLRWPAAVPALIMGGLYFASQVHDPPGIRLTKFFYFYVVTMVAGLAVVAIREFFKEAPLRIVPVVVCFLAAMYMAAGLGKVLLSPTGLEWVRENSVLNLMVSAHGGSWGGMPISLLEGAAPLWELSRQPTMLFVLLIELLAITVFASRRWMKALLLLWLLFHCVVFWTAGAFFFRNMILCGLVLTGFSSWRGDLGWKELGGKYAWIPAGCILAITLAEPYNSLSWFDTPYTHSSKLYGVQPDGERILLSKNDLGARNPFLVLDTYFLLGRDFGYWNTDDYEAFNKLNRTPPGSRGETFRAMSREREAWESEYRTTLVDLLTFYLQRKTAGKPMRLPLSAPRHYPFGFLLPKPDAEQWAEMTGLELYLVRCDVTPGELRWEEPVLLERISRKTQPIPDTP